MMSLYSSIGVLLNLSNTEVNGVNPAWDNCSTSMVLCIVPRIMVRALLQSGSGGPNLNRTCG
jgi:hypothetical protein